MRYSWASMDTNCTSNQPHFTSTCVAGTWQDIEIPFFLFLRFVLLFSNFPQVPSRVMTYPMKWFKKFLWLVGLPAKVPSHLSTVTTMAVFLHITWSSADTMNFPPPLWLFFISNSFGLCTQLLQLSGLCPPERETLLPPESVPPDVGLCLRLCLIVSHSDGSSLSSSSSSLWRNYLSPAQRYSWKFVRILDGQGMSIIMQAL